MAHLINLESVTVSMRDVHATIHVIVILNSGVEIELYKGSDKGKAEELIDKIFKVQLDNKVMLAQRDAAVDFDASALS